MVGDKMANPLARQNMKNYLKKDDVQTHQSISNLNLDNKEHELIQNIIGGSKKTNKITLDELVLRIKEGR